MPHRRIIALVLVVAILAPQKLLFGADLFDTLVEDLETALSTVSGGIEPAITNLGLDEKVAKGLRKAKTGLDDAAAILDGGGLDGKSLKGVTKLVGKAMNEFGKALKKSGWDQALSDQLSLWAEAVYDAEVALVQFAANYVDNWLAGHADKKIDKKAARAGEDLQEIEDYFSAKAARKDGRQGYVRDILFDSHSAKNFKALSNVLFIYLFLYVLAGGQLR